MKETAWSLLSKAVASLFFIGLNIFLARYLGPDNFGAWSYFYSILNIALLLSFFGINQSTKKFTAQFNETDQLGSVLKSSLVIRVSFSFIFVIIFLLIIRPLVSILGRTDFELLLVLATPIIFFAGMVDYLKCAFEGLHRLKYGFFMALTEHGLKFSLTIIILFFMNGLVAIVYSFNLALFVTALVGFYFFYFHFYKNNQVGMDSFSRDIFKYSLPLFFIWIGFVIAVELDVLMIGILCIDSEVGIYAIAKQIIVKLPSIATAISSGSMPVFAKLDKGNKKELKKLFCQLLKINSVIFGVIGLLLLATSWFFIPLIFGKEYTASVVPLMILVFYLILFSYSIFLSSFLDYQGKANKRAVNLIITIALNIILNLMLIPRYGATGAAIGTSISYAPYVFLNWMEVRNILAKYD